MRGCRAIVSRLARVASRDKYLEGGWYGNDTLCRTILDLNRILLYADSRGEMQREIQRRRLFLTDGIIAGEGEGPSNDAMTTSERGRGVIATLPTNPC
jgi:hypothetical protein